MSDLFGAAGPRIVPPPRPSASRAAARVPLAERLRPARLADVLGQEHLTGPEGALTRMLAAGHLPSLVLWGPPGTGKTTIARLLADAVGLRFAQLSAVFSGVADLKRAFAEAEAAPRATLLFVDEIHRFNRAQQDAFLPVVEAGTLTLVGATTENPSFELNAALLSRCQVLVLERLGEPALAALLARAEATEGRALPLAPEARAALLAGADGDGRHLLNQAEALFAAGLDAPLDTAGLAAFVQRRLPVHDKDREGHYGLISALHKAIRGSDPDAALYYLARMLVAGEEPLYLLRRLARAACEDIGLADPTALPAVMAAKEAYDFLGSPEGELAIAQACLHLATAPKSNAVYAALGAATALARETGSVPPPRRIQGAPTRLMRQLGYGQGYEYDHAAPEAFSAADYWPEEVAPAELFQPTDRGAEAAIAERLARWRALRAQRRSREAAGATGGAHEAAHAPDRPWTTPGGPEPGLRGDNGAGS
jgi:putative ATPase